MCIVCGVPVLQIIECKTRNVCNNELFHGEKEKL